MSWPRPRPAATPTMCSSMPSASRVYVSCGEGVVDVFTAEEAGYRRLARVPTVPGARTSLFVPEFDRLFVAVRASSGERAAIWVFRPAP